MHSDAFPSERNEYMRIPSETNDALTLFTFPLIFLISLFFHILSLRRLFYFHGVRWYQENVATLLHDGEFIGNSK